MTRRRAVTVVLVLLGLVFSAVGLYTLQADVAASGQMIAALYGTLGVFLLLAARNPPANRSLIMFAAWANIVHAAVMAAQALSNKIPRSDLLSDVLPVAVFGLVLLVVVPGSPSADAVDAGPTGHRVPTGPLG